MSQPQQPQFDLKNMVMAVAVSLLIVFGWQYYYAIPAAKKAQEAAAQQAQTAQVATTAASEVKDRAAVISATKRIKIDTPAVSGSINLTGAQLDDLQLNKYRETVAQDSPLITLLSPSGSKDAYYVVQSFAAVGDAAVKTPGQATEWQAPEGAVLKQDAPVTLTWDNGQGLQFSREISVSDEYLFTIKDTVKNTGTQPVGLQPVSIVQREDTPKIGGYSTFYEGPLGLQNGGRQEFTYAKLKKDPKTVNQVSATGGWVGFTDKYWSTVAIPDQASKVTAFYNFIEIPGRDGYKTGYRVDDVLTVQPGASASYESHVYAGAKVVNTLNAIGSKYKIDNFNMMIDWGWFWFITQPMFKLLSLVHGLVGNFGIAIMIVTVLVKAVVFPLANRSYASMSKMKNLKPQMDAIKELYPDDRARQQQETMELYKREKVNPMAGCLPIFVQIPIFFSLYKVILITIELRQAPFFGWIHDLSVPDPTSIFNLFGLLPFQPPAALLIGFWPLLMGITMWVQMRLNPAPPDPVQAQMFNWMPVIFTYSMSGFPAGLTIYWAWSNFLSIVQQSYIMKKHGTELDLFGNIRDSLPFLKKKPAAT
ncbi:MAG: membrane protein insertase YidC [Alphaproteobacteria bacterium]|nr:membrane protein insertase YidC [Alphaproteobacteria bacterium]